MRTKKNLSKRCRNAAIVFLPQVVKSDENAPVVEEQMQMRVRIEEIISTDAEFEQTNPEKTIEDREPAILRLNPKSETSNPKWLWLICGVLLFAAIGFVVWNNYFRQSEPKPIAVAKITPFSGATGRENTPAFSPDGKQIAFAWNGGEDDGNFDIYVRLVGAVEPRAADRQPI